ncbi:MAG: hypothetical protein K2K75_03670 [Muribaculaceae bacterium]|nr:hypothetical protein [Muribaculaceae bacterium]
MYKSYQNKGKKDINDETTRLLNEDLAPIEPPKEENTTTNSIIHTSQKKDRKGKTLAAAVGGFVAGGAVGAGATVTASTTSDEAEMPAVEKEEATAEEAVESPTAETPAPEQAILANDEGIRYAHVEADNFNDAYAQARAQVGPGGVFEYNGKIYSTYTAEEWNEMSAEERAEYEGKIFENAPAPQHQPTSHAAAVTDTAEHHEQIHIESTPENNDTVQANAEMIAAEPVDNEIRVLGVEAVQNDYGQIMNVALVECEGDQALLVDVDNNGSIDVLIHDDNFDGQIQETEVQDISGAGLEVADLLQAQAAQEGDVYYASCDDMPDYVNDADSIMTV